MLPGRAAGREVADRVVAAQQRHGTAESLQIIAPAAAGAGVNIHRGVAAEQFIPESQIARDVFDLGDALAIRTVVGAPAGQRVEVEVLAIDINALAGQQTVNPREGPLPCVGIAQVQEPAAFAAQDPLGVLLGEPGTGGDARGLKPDIELEALGVTMVRHLPQPMRKPRRIHLPGAYV